MNDDLVPLTVVASEFEAQEICAMLEVEGIMTTERPTNQGAAAWVGSAGGGSREVLVAARDLERARELIAPVEDSERIRTAIEEIGSKLADRFSELVTHCEFSIGIADARDKAMLARIVAEMHAGSEEPVRRRLLALASA